MTIQAWDAIYGTPMYHSNFVHLHVHTYYSLLDGAAPIYALANRAAEMRMPAMAMTDHGCLFGAIEFYETLSKAGVKPCIGCEVYVLSEGSRHVKELTQGGSLNHLTLLVKNKEGYRNLCKLISASYLEGFYYKPRIDKEILAEHTSGLIALSGCLKGEVSQALFNGRYDEARQVAEYYANLFPEERFFLELQDHGIEGQERVRKGLIELGGELGIGLVATNDVHYIKREDAEAHDALLCVQTAKNISDEKRMRLDTEEFYLKSPEEMTELFSDVPEAIDNTVAIAERLNLEFEFNKYHFPKYAPPEGKDLASYLKEQTYEALEEKWPHVEKHRKGDLELKKQYLERLGIELDVITSMGFAGYFLIVADFISYARGIDLPVGPGRGSAAGSLVAYCLGITNIDPLEHDLLFERFLNPERISMPDVDIDFCMRRRDEVIEYVSKKYGNVSQIITFGKMKARAVIRDVGRVLGIAYGDVDRIAKLIPATIGMTLEQALQIEPRIKQTAKKDEKVAKLLEIARALEGFPRHASTHAAGVVISDRPLSELVPLYRGQKDEIVTQFDMKSVEKIGLIKFDFLGLKTLTVIDDCLKLVEAKKGIKIDIDDIPLDDAKVFGKLSAGDTAGVFQLESSGMTDLVMKLKPSAFSEIVALVALFRPGPLGSGMVDDFINRKHGRTAIKYELPELEGLLKETYGVIVYQEQVMRIANLLASYSLGEADILRRAMGKKKPEEMAKQHERFMKGALANKINKNKAERIFELMAKFAEYGFNKCVVADTELFDAETGEIFTVGDVVKNGPGRMTFSCTEDHRIVPRKILSAMSNGKKKVYKLTTHLGHHILATDNHPFLTMDGWKNLGDLSKGDRIAAPRSIPVKGVDAWPAHEVVTLAWLLSEGNTCHPSSLYFYNNERQLIDDFVEHVEVFENTKARIDARDDGRMEVCVNTGRRVPPHERERYATRSGVFLWAEELGLIGKNATEKTIPGRVFSLANEQIALFLGRLWSGDGFIFGKNNTIPYYATSSSRMAKQLQYLLLRFGIVSRIAEKSFKYRGHCKLGYAVYLTGDNSTSRFLDFISPHMIGRDGQIRALQDYVLTLQGNLSSRDTIPWEAKKIVAQEREMSGQSWNDVEVGSGLSMKEFCGGEHAYKKGFRRSTISKLAHYFSSEKLKSLADSDIYWDEIVDISENGIQETYDLTIDEDHNFVADGIVVHNSHSAAYALVAYQTAYLKTHHSTEFMAALFTAEKDNTDKVLFYINDCKSRDIKMLPPDVNESMRDFSVIGDGVIRFGLAAVKNVGVSAIESVEVVRNEGGPFKSLFDFCERVDSRKVNKRVVESLIKCGAFDFTNAPRASLLAALDRAMEMAASSQRDRTSGQARLFDMLSGEASPEPDLPDVSEWGERQLLAYEKESLGFYITGHPLAQYEELLSQYASTDTADLSDVKDKQEVKIGGVVSKLREITTKRGDRMGFVMLEDLKGSAEVVVFSDIYAENHPLIKGDQPIFVIGTADTDGENTKIIATRIMPIENVAEDLTKSVHFFLHQPEVTPGHLSQLKNVLSRFPGGCPGFIHLVVPDKSETVLSLPDDLKLQPSTQLVTSVNKLFGHNVTKFVS